MAIAEHPFANLSDSLVREAFGTDGSELLIGGFPMRALAERYGTPLFVYYADLIRRAYRALREAISGFAEIYFSIKANPNPAIARILVNEGAGLEIASGGEYIRARSAGAPPDRIIFAGPGKSEPELERVIRDGIGEIHLESYEEIERVVAIGAHLGQTVRVALRVNPVASVQGGAIRMGGRAAPFGFDEECLEEVVDRVIGYAGLDLAGIHLFAGTQILDADVLAAQWMHGVTLARRLGARIKRPLRTIDLGGGLGIPYFAGDPSLDLNRLQSYVPGLAAALRSDPLTRTAHVILEPGRFLVGGAGIYLAQVLSVKTSRGTRFAITDGGMHHHLAASGNLGQIIKRDYPIVAATRLDATMRSPCVVVGPLCTPLDTLARKAELPEMQHGDLVAVLQSGAYALSASPVGFLSHSMPAEILVDRGEVHVIRARGTFEEPLTMLP